MGVLAKAHVKVELEVHVNLTIKYPPGSKSHQLLGGIKLPT